MIVDDALELPGMPAPPGWTIDWARLEAELPELRRLAACPQDPEHHPEGDVLTHTRLACAALAESPAWRALPGGARTEVLWGCLLHDLGKPERTRLEGGRLVSPGHAARGARRARRLLADRGVPVLARERIAALVRLHTLPVMALDQEHGLQRTLGASLVARCDHLALVAEADALGRGSADAGRFVDQVELFREWCEEHGCLAGPARFGSDDERFEYFRRPRAGPPAQIGARRSRAVLCEAVLVAGLPGAGKDHWIAARAGGLPVVALDQLRRARGVSPSRGQGEIVSAARELARQHLRARRSFVWNATNVTRRLRAPLVELFAAYGARVRIVYVEPPLAELRARNRRRRDAVPDAVIDGLLDRLDFPDLTEAHAVDHVVDG